MKAFVTSEFRQKSKRMCRKQQKNIKHSHSHTFFNKLLRILLWHVNIFAFFFLDSMPTNFLQIPRPILKKLKKNHFKSLSIKEENPARSKSTNYICGNNFQRIFTHLSHFHHNVTFMTAIY